MILNFDYKNPTENTAQAQPECKDLIYKTK